MAPPQYRRIRPSSSARRSPASAPASRSTSSTNRIRVILAGPPPPAAPRRRRGRGTGSGTGRSAASPPPARRRRTGRGPATSGSPGDGARTPAPGRCSPPPERADRGLRGQVRRPAGQVLPLLPQRQAGRQHAEEVEVLLARLRHAPTRRPVSSRAERGSGLPAPGRSSKSPRAMPREIWLSTQVSKDIPGGLRSVIALHGDTGLPGSGVRTTSSREAYRNPWIRVREDVIERDGRVDRPVRRRRAARLRAGHPGGAGRLLAGRAVPLPARPPLVGVPAGHLGRTARSGSAEELARAELAEETGIRAGGLRRLGHLDLAPGLMTQGFDVWLATDLTAGAARPRGERGRHAARRSCRRPSCGR